MLFIYLRFIGELLIEFILVANCKVRDKTYKPRVFIYGKHKCVQHLNKEFYNKKCLLMLVKNMPGDT